MGALPRARTSKRDDDADGDDLGRKGQNQVGGILEQLHDNFL